MWVIVWFVSTSLNIIKSRHTFPPSRMLQERKATLHPYACRVDSLVNPHEMKKPPPHTPCFLETLPSYIHTVCDLCSEARSCWVSIMVDGRGFCNFLGLRSPASFNELHHALRSQLGSVIGVSGFSFSSSLIFQPICGIPKALHFFQLGARDVELTLYETC